MSEQEFMKQTASIFCQDPKMRQNQYTKERMQQYDQILCQTLGKRYPVQQNETIQQDLQYNSLPQQNTLLDSFIKNLLISDKGALFVYNEQQKKIPQTQNIIQHTKQKSYDNSYQQQSLDFQQSDRYFQLSQRLQNNIKQNQINYKEQQQIYVPIIKSQDFNETQLFQYSNSRLINQQQNYQQNEQFNEQNYCFDSIEESKRRRKQQLYNFKFK